MPYISIIHCLRADVLAPLSPIIECVLCEPTGCVADQALDRVSTSHHPHPRSGTHTHTHTYLAMETHGHTLTHTHTGWMICSDLTRHAVPLALLSHFRSYVTIVNKAEFIYWCGQREENRISTPPL